MLAGSPIRVHRIKMIPIVKSAERLGWKSAPENAMAWEFMWVLDNEKHFKF